MKILLLYGNDYLNFGLDSLSKSLSLLDDSISVDFITNPWEALEKIKEYDCLVMGLIWSHEESGKVIVPISTRFPLIGAASKYNSLIHNGILLYYIFQEKYPIRTIIYDTILPSEMFANEHKIRFLRMPELVKDLLFEIKRFEKKEAV